MPRNRRKTIKFHVFDYYVTVILSRDIVASGKRIKEDLRDAGGAFCQRDGKDALPHGNWIILPERPEEWVIAHEASHCVRHMLTQAGAVIDDEVFAYHLAHLVDLIHKFIAKSG